MTQEQVGYFRPRPGVDHTTGALPVLLDYHTDPPFYSLPQIEVPGVKVGWHHTGAEIDPDQPQPLDGENMQAVQDFVSRRYPHVEPTPFETAVCLYTNTVDYHFILDHHPDYPHVLIAVGFSGHGFKFAPVLGQILAALSRGTAPPLSLAPFSLSRFATPDELTRRTTA